MVYLAPTRVLRDDVSQLARKKEIFPEDAEQLILGQAATECEEAPYDGWLERRMQEESEELIGLLLEEEEYFASLPAEQIVTSAMVNRAKRHHDATFQLYVRRWHDRRDHVYKKVRFVSMTRTLGLKCFAGLSPVRNLFRGRRLVLLCDELEDWSASQLLAVSAHCDIVVAAGDEDQTLRPAHRRILHESFAGVQELMKPMQTEAAALSICLRFA